MGTKLKKISEIQAPEQQNSIRVNQKLIQRAINEGFINELAFFYLLKYHFIHSRISSENKPKVRISNFTGLSIPTINKYLSVLHYKGLLRPYCHGWELSPTRSRKRCKITVNHDVTVSQIKSLLYLKDLEGIGYRQALYNSIIEYIKPSKLVKELPEKLEPDTSFKPILSVRYIASKLNICIVTANRLIHELNNAGLIRTTFDGSKYLFHCRQGDDRYLDGLFNHKYTQAGALYYVEPARHEFLLNPIYLRPMTLSYYSKVTKSFQIRKFVNNLNLMLTN